jgi:DNA-nicking Smr family endonuclease
MLYYLPMNRKKPLTAEEQALFFEAVKNVKPLKGSRKSAFLAKSPPIPASAPKKAISLSTEYQYSPVDLEILAPEDWVGIEECIQFNRAGLQNKLLKKLAHGQLAIEVRLDLHSLHLAAALAQAQAFLGNCQRQGRRLVLIIHGKGKKSDKPILKNALNIWLRTQTNVLAFHSAQPKDGGTGAVYVLLKKANSVT